MSRLPAALLVLSSAAHAWDSRCEVDGAEGPAAAAHRLIDAQQRDEHRQIWLTTLSLASAPAVAGDDFTLDTFTTSPTTLAPSHFDAAQVTHLRTHAPSEFTQLPDFSYALWDWATGNETCPIQAGLDPVSCHSFAQHMGAVNSNHFNPQTQANWNRYHQLALQRASACKGLRMTLMARPDLQPFVEACESEALVLEAIAHHFLQDAWSMGHQWQRWGSANVSDFPSPTTALAVAGFSGLIHGARAVLQPASSSALDVDDALCAPGMGVEFSSQGTVSAGVGDMYLPALLAPNTPFAAEYQGMFGCTVGSLRAVLTAAGETLGAASSSISPLDPASHAAECFGQRATNFAMAAGFAIDFTVAGAQTSIPLSYLAAGLTPVVVSGLAPVQAAPLGYDVLRAQTVVLARAIADPHGTDVANGGLGDFLGVQANGAYPNLGTYLDPDLPWPSVRPSAAGHEDALAREFHRAHAKDWCDLFKPGDPELDVEKLQARSSADGGNPRSTACDVCIAFAERHLRIGDPATYVATASNEPLCGLIATTPAMAQYVYQSAPSNAGPTATRAQLARHYCGCKLITVTPTNVHLAGGATQQFTATVFGSSGSGVSWASTAGSIDGTGLFTAPMMSGPVTVRASDLDDFDEVTVQVGGNGVYLGSLTDNIDQSSYRNCTATPCSTRHGYQHDTYSNLRFELQPNGTFIATGTIDHQSLDEIATDDGCDSVVTESGTGTVTSFSGHLPGFALGYVGGSALVTRTTSNAACRGQPMNSSTSMSQTSFLVGNTYETATFSPDGGTLTGLDWSGMAMDLTNTTYSTMGHVALQ